MTDHELMMREFRKRVWGVVKRYLLANERLNANDLVEELSAMSAEFLATNHETGEDE